MDLEWTWNGPGLDLDLDLSLTKWLLFTFFRNLSTGSSIVEEMSPLTPFVLKSKIKLMENATRYGQIYDHLVKILARETHCNKSKDE